MAAHAGQGERGLGQTARSHRLYKGSLRIARSEIGIVLLCAGCHRTDFQGPRLCLHDWAGQDVIG